MDAFRRDQETRIFTFFQQERLDSGVRHSGEGKVRKTGILVRGGSAARTIYNVMKKDERERNRKRKGPTETDHWGSSATHRKEAGNWTQPGSIACRLKR